MAVLAGIQKKQGEEGGHFHSTAYGKVLLYRHIMKKSMPARTISSLQQQDYPNTKLYLLMMAVLTTHTGLFETFTGNPRVRVFTKPNGGKASALELWDPDSRQRIRGMHRCRYPVEKRCRA